MNLRNLSDDKILSLTQALVAEERETTTAILHYLAEIDRRRLFAKVACSSLFDYCVRVLSYSEAAAQRRIAAARLLEKIPGLAEKIETGRLSLTAITLANVFFKRENSTVEEKMAILRKLEGQSQRSTERILAALATIVKPVREVVRQVNGEISELRVPLNSREMENFLRLKEVWKLDSFQEVLSKMLDQTLQRVDPVKIARRNASFAGEVKNTSSRYIPAPIRHAVWLRDEGRCTFTTADRVCKATYGLELDHIIPWAKGGSHSVDNLRLRCFAHNQLHAREQFPNSAKLSLEGGASSGPP